MSDYNFAKLEIANAKVEEVRKMQIEVLRDHDAIIAEDATLAECANAITTVVLKAQSFYRCLSVDRQNKRWTGYRGAFASDGSWVFEREPSHLTYTYIAPEEGCMYSADGQLRLLAVNSDPRFLDVFWKEDWQSDPLNKKLVLVDNPLTGTQDERWEPQPTTATKVEFYYGREPLPDAFGLDNDTARIVTDVDGKSVTIPGREMSCVVCQDASAFSGPPAIYAVGEYNVEKSQDVNIPDSLVFSRQKFLSKDFSFFCWYKGKFRHGDMVLNFVADPGTPVNASDPGAPGDRPAVYEPERYGFCMRFALFSYAGSHRCGWKPGFADNDTAYEKNYSPAFGELYHDLFYQSNTNIYSPDYWHLFGVTYDHRTDKLCGYIDGQLIGEPYKVLAEGEAYENSIMDIANCTVLVGLPGRDGNNNSIVGESVLSRSCFSQEQIDYLANQTRLVTKRKPLIAVRDVTVNAYVDEEFYIGSSSDPAAGSNVFYINDNFSSLDPYDGTLTFKLDGKPDWLYAELGNILDSEHNFYGTPPAVGVYTFTVTVSGTPPEGYPPPEPVTATFTINVK